MDAVEQLATEQPVVLHGPNPVIYRVHVEGFVQRVGVRFYRLPPIASLVSREDSRQQTLGVRTNEIVRLGVFDRRYKFFPTIVLGDS